MQRGDTVQWVERGNYAGFRSAPVVSADEKTVTVFTIDGDYRTLHRDSVRPSNDGRSKRLQVLDIESPREAADLREQYIEAYVKKIETRVAESNSDDDKDRPRRVTRSVRNSDSEQILAIIEQADYRVTKPEIIEVTQLSEGRYNNAMKELKTSGRIQQHGTRRGASYSPRNKDLPARPVEQSVSTKSSRKSQDDEKIVATYLKPAIEAVVNADEPQSRADIIESIGCSTQEWAVVARTLKDHKKIKVVGKKRGTRYQAA